MSFFPPFERITKTLTAGLFCFKYRIVAIDVIGRRTVLPLKEGAQAQTLRIVLIYVVRNTHFHCFGLIICEFCHTW